MEKNIKDLDILTLPQAMQYLQITRVTLMKLVRSGEIKHKKIGRIYRFVKEDLKDYILQGEIIK